MIAKAAAGETRGSRNALFISVVKTGVVVMNCMSV